MAIANNNTVGGNRPIRELPTSGSGSTTTTPPTPKGMSEEQKKMRETMRKFRIVGQSPALLAAVSRALRVAPADMSVLIIGETGTGKENIARIIQDNSKRKHQPFLTLNCGALASEGTIESELFGHVKGAFTGADTDHEGYFERADGGTIFLDEITEMPLTVQVKLLRVIEYGEYFRMGDSLKTPRKTNVRIIAATNRDVTQAIEEGKFREDLYYRISTIIINLPPLRERGNDIKLLVDDFIDKYVNDKHSKKPMLTKDAYDALARYSWNGNIRQLLSFIQSLCLDMEGQQVTQEMLYDNYPYLKRNNQLIPREPSAHYKYDEERAVIFRMITQLHNEIDAINKLLSTRGYGESAHVNTSISDLRRTPHQLSMESMSEVGLGHYDDMAVDNRLTEDLGHADEVFHHNFTSEPPATIGSTVRPLGDLQRDSIEEALNEFGGNRRKAATALGISERTLYRKIKRYGLE